MNVKGDAGGAAMAGGQRFQARVTAWWGARILLETPVGQAYGIAAMSIAQRLYCEAPDSVDDIRVELSGNERIFGQCKIGLSLSAQIDSKLASVLAQFYGELERATPEGVDRRFVLFYEKHNGNLEKLKVVLDRYRELPAGTPVIEAALNASERKIVNVLNSLLDSLEAKPEFRNLITVREGLLRRSHVKQLQLGSGETDSLGVADALQNGLILNPTQTTVALNSLHTLADDLLAERGSIDRLGLRRRLQGEGIALRESISLRSDFEKLDAWSRTELEAHEDQGRTKLAIGEHQVTITRAVVSIMIGAAQRGSFIVIGGAGSGKTGSLVELATRLRFEGQRVWYWAADSLPAHSPQEMAVQLQLDHSWTDLFTDAASGTGTVLIVDGLDGLRDTQAQHAYRKLFEAAKRNGVRVIASIRSFDLQYAVDLQTLFRVADLGIPPEFISPAFRRFSHVLISELVDEELLQVCSQLPQVGSTLLAAPQLIGVVRNLFSLDLLCQLIVDGGHSELSSISTQAELFERYWENRVTANELRDEMTNALRALIENVTANRTLQVVPEEWGRDVKTALFSAGLVRYPASAPGRLPEYRLIEFTHHLLFDYAAELLFVRPRRDRLAEELAADDTWGLFLRPSLSLFHLYVWRNGPVDFWETLVGLERGTVPMLHRLPGYMSVSEAAQSREDLQPLVDGAIRDDEHSPYWLKLLKGVISAASFISLPRLFNEGRGDYWLEFAKDLVTTGKAELVQEGQWVLFTAARFAEELSTSERLIFNQTAIALHRYHTGSGMQPSPALRFAIEGICLTADADRDASIDSLRQAITLDQLQRFGYIQAYEVTNQIEQIWALEPALGVEVYDAIFGYVEPDSTAIPINNSLIQAFTAAKNQEYEMSYHLLTWKFGAFMSQLPREATQAMIRVMRHYRDQEHPPIGEAPIKTFMLNGRECHFLSDSSAIWDVHDYDEQQKISRTWESPLVSLSAEADAAKWEGICDVLVDENELATVWRRLLLAAAREPAFYAARLWTMLREPVILGEDDTEEAATDCIRAFAPHLTNIQLEEIVAAAIALRRENMPYIDDNYAVERLSYLKIKFLLAIPEDRRSQAATDFLSACEPELLKPFQRQRVEDPYLEAAVFEQFREEFGAAKETRAVVGPLEDELLQISAPLMQFTAGEMTDDFLPTALHALRESERLLDEGRDSLPGELVRNVGTRILRGFSVIAVSDATCSEELTVDLFGRFRGVLENQEVGNVHAEGGSNPFLIAVDGVLALARKTRQLPKESPELLKRLFSHPITEVRQRVARKIWTLFAQRPDFVWELLESWVRELPSAEGAATVLGKALVGNWFWFLRDKDRDRADTLLHSLWAEAHVQGDADLRLHCSELMTALWVVKENESAKNRLEEAIASPLEYLKELWGVVRFSGFGLFPSKDDKDFLTPAQKLVNSTLLVDLLKSVKGAVDRYFSDIENTPEADRQADHPEWVQAPGKMFSHISLRIRFAGERQAEHLSEMPVDERENAISEWWSYSEPILGVLLSIPHPRFAFDLVEGLEHLIDFDFKKALHWISRATVASAPAGFAGETLVQSKVIRILERTLAEHRFSLADASDVRADFLNTLEAFLAVGHPGAMSLAIQIDSIFR